MLSVGSAGLHNQMILTVSAAARPAGQTLLTPNDGRHLGQILVASGSCEVEVALSSPVGNRLESLVSWWISFLGLSKASSGVGMKEQN